jgi:hypothetical protein
LVKFGVVDISQCPTNSSQSIEAICFQRKRIPSINKGNPRTSEVLKIPATVPKFSVGAAVKAAMNKKK